MKNDFPKEQQEYLERNGFSFDETDGMYSKHDPFNEDLAIEYDGDDCYNFYVDVQGDDLERANNNETKNDLTWDEVKRLVGDDN